MFNNLVIWLDDRRNPFSYDWYPVIQKNTHDFKGEPAVMWIKTYEKFCDWMSKVMDDPVELFPALVCFDHDLGEEKTGLDCAKVLVETCMKYNMPLPKFECHSSNPDGRENILSYLNSYLKSLKIFKSFE